MEFEYTQEDQINTAQGLYLAAGLSDFKDNRTDEFSDPSYGKIKFYRKSWSETQTLDGGIIEEKKGDFIDWDEIKTRPCNQDDFNYGEGATDSKFF